jgi:hypothetical protein
MNNTVASGLGTWPEFKKEMDIYIFQDAVLAELEKCSEYRLKNDESEPTKQQHRLKKEDA